jgi:hypothetical protein
MVEKTSHHPPNIPLVGIVEGQERPNLCEAKSEGSMKTIGGRILVGVDMDGRFVGRNASKFAQPAILRHIDNGANAQSTILRHIGSGANAQSTILRGIGNGANAQPSILRGIGSGANAQSTIHDYSFLNTNKHLTLNQ